jgi:hypothetical protein
MVEENPSVPSSGLESDASQKEKIATTVDHLDLPDPDAHLSDAERKAIVCSLDIQQFSF